MTLSPDAPPPEFRRLHVQREIGSGREKFDNARAAIIDWAGHRRAGATLEPERPALDKGTTVGIALRVWPLWVTACCDIVEVVDEPDRFGFACGTLGHHPARGEESFFVTRDPATDSVRLEVTALSVPASLPAKVSGPVGRLIQRFAAGRYLDGFEQWRPGGES